MMESLDSLGGQADQVVPQVLGDRAGSVEVGHQVDGSSILLQLSQPVGGIIKASGSGIGQVAQHKQ